MPEGEKDFFIACEFLQKEGVGGNQEEPMTLFLSMEISVQHPNGNESLNSKTNSCLGINILNAIKINQKLSKNCTEWLKGDNLPTGHGTVNV